MARQVLLVAFIVFTHGILLVAGQLECDDEPCKNGGTCVPGTGDYTCTCVDGWTGKECDSDITCECTCESVACDDTINVCANNGTCGEDKMCTCAPGFAGDLCTDIDQCTCESVACDDTVNVCANGGTCGEDKKCTCASGYTGDLCTGSASLSTASCLILALALALTKMATD